MSQGWGNLTRSSLLPLPYSRPYCSPGMARLWAPLPPPALFGQGALPAPRPMPFLGAPPQLSTGFGSPNPSGDKAWPSLSHAAQAQQGQGPPGPPTACSSQGPWLTPATWGLALNAAFLTEYSMVCCYSLFCGGVPSAVLRPGEFSPSSTLPSPETLHTEGRGDQNHQDLADPWRTGPSAG